MNLKDGHRQMVHETERLQKEMSAKWIDTFRRVAVPDRGEVCCAFKNVFGIFWPELSSSIAMTDGSGSNTIFKIRGWASHIAIRESHIIQFERQRVIISNWILI